jgi:hypothetical protein
MTGRRGLTVAVVACVAAAALALFAASRTWQIEITVRPQPLPAVTTNRSGGSLVPALPALAFVALAGAGALIAARGLARALVGLLLVAAGLGMAGALVRALGDGVAPGWVVASALAGLVVAGVGGFTLRYGRGWPGLGSRYDRAAPSGSTPTGMASAGERAVDPESAAEGPSDVTGVSLWDAIDRGEDPTKYDKSGLGGMG